MSDSAGMTGPGLTLVIGDKNLSSWSLRPWLALSEAGIAFEEVLVRLDRPSSAAEIAQHSPSGTVPVLKHGTRIIWDSLAIMEYAAELKPEAGLWPQEAGARALARSVCAEMHSGFFGLRTDLPMAFAEDIPAHQPNAHAKRDIARILALWSGVCAQYGAGGPFLFGAFSNADAMFAPVVSRFVTYDVPVPNALRPYMEAVWTLPAMQAWGRGAAAEIAQNG